MSQSLIDLHILTAKATISHEKYIAGIITTEEFLKEMESIDCHCHTDIKLEDAIEVINRIVFNVNNPLDFRTNNDLSQIDQLLNDINKSADG